ncbi:MAG TPA: hypothetical protein VD973_10930 [Symbiobacteriaceae bacterium]|nr:hypothetical protein [Symbiobacteriaceae bacterium]
MEKKDEKNQHLTPSDTAAAHNVPEPEPGRQPMSPQVPAEPDPHAPAAPTPEVRYSNNTEARNVLRRNMHQPGCWAQGGTLECFAAVDWALTELAGMRGIDTNPNTDEVERVRAARFGKERRIWIHPTDSLDTRGTELKRNKKGQLRIPLYNYLAREKLLIAIGKRERFDLEVITDSRSPVGPALLLDFSKPLETKVLPPPKKKGEQGTKENKKKGPDKKGPELKNPEPETEPDEEEE